MTHKTQVSPHQWQLLKRLDAAGCPISWDQFEEPCDPVRLIHDPPALGTDIFPLTSNRTGLAFRVRIAALRRFTIQNIALRARCGFGGLTWLSTQYGIGSFPYPGDGEVRFAAAGLLNSRLVRGLTLKAGEVVSGYIALLASRAIPPSDESLAATLLIHDQFDRAYPYELDLANSQVISGPGDRHCGFVTASQLEQEEAARVAAEAKQAEPPKPRPATLWISNEELEEISRRNRRPYV